MGEYKLAPVKPTPEMEAAGKHAMEAGCYVSGIYADMLAEVPAMKSEDVESVWMYKGKDGRWNQFINKKHRLNTIADGGWDVREFFSTPAVQGEPDIAQLVEALQLCTESMRDAFPNFDHFESPAYKNAVALIAYHRGEEE